MCYQIAGKELTCRHCPINADSNYCPISLVSNLSEMMEKYNKQQLINDLEKHHIKQDRKYNLCHTCSTGDMWTGFTPILRRSMHHYFSSTLKIFSRTPSTQSIDLFKIAVFFQTNTVPNPSQSGRLLPLNFLYKTLAAISR